MVSRRMFLKGAGVAAAAMCTGLYAQNKPARNTGKTNIVLIMADDMGY